MKKISAVLFAVLLTALLAVGASAKTAKLGDINSDGDITAADARLILRFSATIDIPTQEQAVLSDVNGDNNVTAADARIVLRVAATIDPALGEIELGEDGDEDTTTAVDDNNSSSERIEVKDGIGMTVSNFIKQYGGMIKDGTTDGSTMYHNNDLIIVSDPKMIDDLKINSITVTGDKYTLNGIYVDMTSARAKSSLSADGWKLKTESDNVVVYSKQSDLMKLTVKNGVISQAELCLAFSIATEIPTETTTKEPDTQDSSPSESTTAPADDYLTIDELPDNVRTFLSGKFGFTGVVYNSEGETNNVTMYTDGQNFNVGMDMDSVSVEFLILDEGGDEPGLYIINKKNSKYHKFSKLEQVVYGIDAANLVSGFKINDASAVKFTEETIKDNGVKYTVYNSTTGSDISKIYTLNGDIKRIQTVDTSGKQLNRIDVDEFYSEFPASVFTYSQYDSAGFIETIY